MAEINTCLVVKKSTLASTEFVSHGAEEGMRTNVGKRLWNYDHMALYKLD